MTSSSSFTTKKKTMIEAGSILKKVVSDLKPHIKPGIKTAELDKLASELILHYGGEISFNKVPGYQWATCMSVNEVIVHGVPNNYVLKPHDLLKLDIGVYLNGYHTDYGDSFYLGKAPPQIERFMQTGREVLHKVIGLTKAGVHIGKVSQTIEKAISKAGYKVINNLTGHAVGKELHEDPIVPQFLDCPIKQTPRFQAGNAYALEIIYSLSDNEVSYANQDGWSLKTKGGSHNCCFESTVFVDKDKTIVITN
jgi:methionyl aminopeptidase